MKRAAPTVRSSVRRELSLDPARGRRSGVLRLATAVALLACAGGGPAAALGPFRQEVIPGFSSLAPGNRASASFADLDGDGDLDVVFGVESGQFRYFENTGSPASPAFVARNGSANPFAGLDVGCCSRPDLADLDGDGDLDAIANDFYGPNRFLENTGTSAAPSFVMRDEAKNPFNQIRGPKTTLADLDGDGDVDAVAESFPDPWGFQPQLLDYFENVGSSTTPAFVERTGPANPFHRFATWGQARPDLVDLDGDSDLDVVVAAHQTLLYLENTGTPVAPAFVERTGNANPLAFAVTRQGTSAELADLDGDGDPDLVLGDYYADLRYLENTGSPTAPAFRAGPHGTGNPIDGVDIGSSSAPDLGDLDGDGDLDVVVGEGYGRLRYFVGTGSSTAPAFEERIGPANPLAGVDVGWVSRPALADLDADGDLDLAVMGFPGGISQGSPPYLENTGSSLNPAFFPIAGAENPFAGIDGAWTRVGFADLDGDGDLDFATARDQPRYFENVGAPNDPVFSLVTGAADPFAGIMMSETCPAFADLDWDGDMDAVVGDFDGILATLENVGTPLAPAFVQRTGAENPLDAERFDIYLCPTLADLDGDGDADILAGAGSGELVFLRSLLIAFRDGFESGDVSAWSGSHLP